mmetsp:Transcript_4523/g.13706  ORF Transcript_4523/g.13706 Transcript_4523/m.13706 type:complete len:222 (+) Transcript_4523:1323-1988(+)
MGDQQGPQDLREVWGDVQPGPSQLRQRRGPLHAPGRAHRGRHHGARGEARMPRQGDERQLPPGGKEDHRGCHGFQPLLDKALHQACHPGVHPRAQVHERLVLGPRQRRHQHPLRQGRARRRPREVHDDHAAERQRRAPHRRRQEGHPGRDGEDGRRCSPHLGARGQVRHAGVELGRLRWADAQRPHPAPGSQQLRQGRDGAHLHRHGRHHRPPPPRVQAGH